MDLEMLQGNGESWVLSGRVCEAEKKLERNKVLIVKRECILQGMAAARALSVQEMGRI